MVRKQGNIKILDCNIILKLIDKTEIGEHKIKANKKQQETHTHYKFDGYYQVILFFLTQGRDKLLTKVIIHNTSTVIKLIDINVIKKHPFVWGMKCDNATQGILEAGI